MRIVADDGAIEHISTSHRAGPDPSEFAAEHPGHPIQPNGETGHRPSSTCRNAHASPPWTADAQDIKHVVEDQAVVAR